MAALGDVLRKVQRIEIRTNRLVNETLAGQYHSIFRGRGIDFDRVREYSPGDDVRRIDWNVTARAGRPFVKELTEEREQLVLLLVDLSASGEFGSVRESKRELAAEVASVLAFSAIRNSDKVGAVLFTDRIERYVPPGRGRSHVLRVIHEILACEPRGTGTDVAMALDFAGSVTRKRAIAFVVSDLATDAEEARARMEKALTVAALRHDVIALRIRDRHEDELPNVGVLTLEDAESGELIDVDTSRKKVRDVFRVASLRERAEIDGVLRRAGVESIELHTAAPYAPALVALFRARARRRVRCRAA